MKPRDHDHVRPWFDLATADRAMVALVVADEHRTPAMCGLACFHAQQAAEEALKGLPIARDLPLPRSHDLVMLADRATQGSLSDELQNALAALNEYGVGPRYPGIHDDCLVADVHMADGHAELVLRWVSSRWSGK